MHFIVLYFSIWGFYEIKRAYDKIIDELKKEDFSVVAKKNKLQPKERIREERLDKFEKNYPKGFQTYLLFGNHDVEFQFGEHDLYFDIPTLRSDVIPLGAGGCYVNIRGKRVYLSHPVDNQMYPSLVPRATTIHVCENY